MTDALITAIVSNEEGDIFDLEGYAAAGMAGDSLFPLTDTGTIELPFGSELMRLPDRAPVLYDLESGSFKAVEKNPYAPEEDVFPVAAFNSPGHVISAVSAYRQRRDACVLPLFSYGAVGWGKEGFRSAAILVDAEPRQDLRFMKQADVLRGVEAMRKKLPGNRLRKHLETCALEYGCPAGKNFFLGRYEAPLPAAKACNAACLGCLSLQQGTEIHCSQERIDFTPKPEEIAAVALEHIGRVENCVVSFGQGCEGDPLTAAGVIGPAIGLIRSATNRGTINMNTNGGLPDALKTLVEAGLDSVRISLNSVREPCYRAYFNPKYTFDDVKKSIDTALQHGRHVAINYLNLPGFTDTPGEMESLAAFLADYPIHMIQWRNLNFDPLHYWEAMDRVCPLEPALGMQAAIEAVRCRFPDVRHGYFNPPT
ncbi:MAG: radical SAM protein [Deltaproteobacteria bacterium]|nr:radical SAM protein [Deltaproteobacteria bacterium]